MSSISRVSLEDTLNLIQLARETALARGKETQASLLVPVMKEMRTLAATHRTVERPMIAPSNDILGQSDFRRLLEVTQSRMQPDPQAQELKSAMERNRLIVAMSDGAMADVEIAKQFGITREEVRLVLSVNERSKMYMEVRR